MYTYKIIHTRKSEEVLTEALNSVAQEGWKLHTMFEKASSFMLVLEHYEAGSPKIFVKDEGEEQPKTSKRRTRTEPILVTSENTDAS